MKMLKRNWGIGIVISIAAVLLIMFLLVPMVVAEEMERTPPAKEWSRTFGGAGNDSGKSIQQTNDDGFIITGKTSSFGAGEDDLWLIKTDSEGNKEWSHTFGGAGNDWGKSIQQTNDDGFIITGLTSSFGAGGLDLWLIKTDSDGNKEWSRTFGGAERDLGFSVQQTTNSGFIIIGWTESFGAGGRDMWLIKTDSEGNKEWNRTFGGAGNDWGKSIQQTTDGGFIITGRAGFFSAGFLWLIKTDSMGNKEWNRIFDDAEWSWGESVQQTTDGGFIITGWRSGFVGCDLWLIKTDSEGNEEWSRTFGDDATWDLGKSVQQTTDGGFIVTGWTASFGAFFDVDAEDLWLIKTDSMGNKEWSQTFGGVLGKSVQQTDDGGFIITGSTKYFGAGEYDLWLIKFESEEAQITAIIWEIARILQKERSAGFNMDEAKFLLAQAEQALIYMNYNKAFKLAIVTNLAIDVDQDGTPNHRDFAPTINNNHIYIGAVGAFVFVVALMVGISFYRRRKR